MPWDESSQEDGSRSGRGHRGERSSSAVPPFSPSDPEALEICSGGLEPPRWSPATVHRDDDGRCDVSEYAAATNLKGSSIVRYPAPRLRCTESILAVLRSLGCLSLSQKMLATMCEPFVAGVDNGCHRSGPIDKRIKQVTIFFLLRREFQWSEVFWKTFFFVNCKCFRTTTTMFYLLVRTPFLYLCGSIAWSDKEKVSTGKKRKEKKTRKIQLER